LSEISYDPLGAEPDGEWIELYNAGEYAADLQGYKLGDEETTGGGEGMYTFPAGAFLPPHRALVVAYRADVFINVYGFAPDYEILDTDDRVDNLSPDNTWATGTLNLRNAGDEVLLLDSFERWVDAISYGDSRVVLDPPIALAPEGYSLERYPPGVDHDLADDWRPAPAPDPAQVDLTPPTSTPTGTPLPHTLADHSSQTGN